VADVLVFLRPQYPWVASAPGAQLRLVPRVTPAGMVEWRCRATGYPAAERLPACQP